MTFLWALYGEKILVNCKVHEVVRQERKGKIEITAMDKHLINLLNYGFTIAKHLLEEQVEFYPIAVYLNKNNEPLQHIVSFGDEFPLSTELIKQLEMMY